MGKDIEFSNLTTKTKGGFTESQLLDGLEPLTFGTPIKLPVSRWLE